MCMFQEENQKSKGFAWERGGIRRWAHWLWGDGEEQLLYYKVEMGDFIYNGSFGK